MIAIRIALTALLAAIIAQLAFARIELASTPETMSVAVDTLPVHEQMFEFQQCITLRHLPAGAWFERAPRALEPFRCRGS